MTDAAVALRLGEARAAISNSFPLLPGMLGKRQMESWRKMDLALVASRANRADHLRNTDLYPWMKPGVVIVAGNLLLAGCATDEYGNKIASVVNKYGKTQLAIAGHTDSTRSLAYNQNLSERHAEAVRTYLLGDNVYPARLSAAGYGPSQPIANNDTDEGRRRNRRVGITIIPVTAQT